jgi:uroporphyrinogen III methyltransferase/synthase
VSSAVVLVTGHEEPGKAESDLDYAALARIGTVVFYMGVGLIVEIARRLMASGRAGVTPVAVIERATTARQRTVRATLATVGERVRAEKVEAPAVTVVGDVAALGERLAWAERQPLWGRTILVTRTREQASELVRQLRDLGARVLELPTIAVEPLPQDELAGAIEDLAEFDWVVFTSANAVELFFKCLAAGGGDARTLAGRRVAAIGPATAARLAEHGIRADLVPEEAVAESLAAALVAAGVGAGTRVLLPRAAEARDVLTETLRQEGALVEAVAVYRTVVPAAVDEACLEALGAGEVDLVTLTSSSTARQFVSLMQSRGGEELLGRLKGQLKFASIGPITSRTAAELGLKVAVESAEHTAAGLVEAIRRWGAKQSSGGG